MSRVGSAGRAPAVWRMTSDPNRFAPAAAPETDQGRDSAGPQCGHRVVGQGDRDDLRGRGHDPDQRDDEQDAVPPVRGRLGLERPARRATAAERGDRERDDRQDRDGDDEAPRQPLDRLASGDEPPHGAHQADDDDGCARGHEDRHGEDDDRAQALEGTDVPGRAGDRLRRHHEIPSARTATTTASTTKSHPLAGRAPAPGGPDGKDDRGCRARRARLRRATAGAASDAGRSPRRRRAPASRRPGASGTGTPTMARRSPPGVAAPRPPERSDQPGNKEPDHHECDRRRRRARDAGHRARTCEKRDP